MKFLVAFVSCIALVLALGAFAQDAEAPDEMEFESAMGNVTFSHAKHVEYAEDNCEACHDNLFPQSREPLNFKAGMHKPAISAKESCGGCHNPDGPSFDASDTANCKNCHVK